METIRQQRRREREHQADQERRISTIRATIGADEVRLHHEPRWIKQRISAAIKLLSLRRAYPGEDVGVWRFVEMLGENPSWIDHWGSIESGVAFVSEPYFNIDHTSSVLAFANALDLRCDVSSVSWWNPPSTTRLVFRPKSVSA